MGRYEPSVVADLACSLAESAGVPPGDARVLADALVEASGAPPVLADAWNSLRPNGIVTVVALYGANVDFAITQFVRKQIDVRVTYASSKPDYLNALDLLQQGTVDLDALVKFYPLAEAEQGFLDGESQAVMKPMLVCSE